LRHMQRFQGLIGIFLILGLAFIFSNNRRRINLRLVFTGLLLQLFIGIMVLKITPVIHFFQFLGRVMGKMEQFAFQGRLLCMTGCNFHQAVGLQIMLRWICLCI
jgi:CNT family concentrative nucleoside transporter